MLGLVPAVKGHRISQRNADSQNGKESDSDDYFKE